MNAECISTFIMSLPIYNLIFPGRAAIDQIFRVINEQSQPTFDENFNFISFFNWTGGGGSLSPSVNNFGNGEPKAYSGLVATQHRPSDDLTTFRKKSPPSHGVELTLNRPAFLVPANAMLSVELAHLANMLDATGQLRNVSEQAKEWSSRIHDAIWKTTVL